jgi:hypothetical protein
MSLEVAPMDTAHEVPKTPPTVFICYAKKNNVEPGHRKQWLDTLLMHLKPLQREQLATIWCDQRLEQGNLWNQEIQAALQTTKVAILLLSPAFYDSEYIYEHEMPVLLERQAIGKTTLIPIVLSPCSLKEITFPYRDAQGEMQRRSLDVFQGANSLNNPLMRMSEPEQDEILLSVAKQVRKLVTPPKAELPAAQVIPAETAPQSKQVPLSATKRRLLELEKARIEQEWTLTHEKLSHLRGALICETGAAVKFQLERQIAEEEGRLNQLETTLDQLDADLSD